MNAKAKIIYETNYWLEAAFYLGNAEMFDFYHDEAGFDERRIKKHFGDAVYEACSDRLKLGDLKQSNCEHAYAGFHCIVSVSVIMIQ